MLHSTKGIVLRTVRYGDTSIVVSIYTELFGVQSYIVNGVRTEKRSAVKANLYQPYTLLDLVVYHTPNKNLQRIREARVYHLYTEAQQNMVKNAIAIYIVELIGKTISEPETNAELFAFFEEAFLRIDARPLHELADLPVLFTLQLAAHLGFGIQNRYDDAHAVFDLQNGMFCSKMELHSPHFIEGEMAHQLSALVHGEVDQALLPMNRQMRRDLLGISLQYLRLHIPHLGELRSPEVLHAVMS